METETPSYENPSLVGDGSEEGSDLSDSFDKRQLIGAERDEPDPLPAVEGLRISGEACPGKSIQACGFTINGTVRCDFAWVRFYDDGSSSYIPGENTAVHLVTADDVDSYLAVEVIPVGKDGQMGDLVRICANEKRKITCDNEMQEQIERDFFKGHASFNVELLNTYSSWEKVKLGITRNGFKIEVGKLPLIVDKKFLPTMAITIPKESATEFEIHNTSTVGYNCKSLVLKAESSLLRDIIVLTMRSFLHRATQKPKKKKRTRCFFFSF